MDDQEITTLLSQVANADQILSDPSIFFLEQEGTPLPRITVEPKDIGLSLEDKYSYTIGSLPLLVQSVESRIHRKAVPSVGEVAKLRARLVEALCERHAAELNLLISYGILCRHTVPRSGLNQKGVHAGLPDDAAVSVRSDDLIDFALSALARSETTTQRQR